MFFILDLYMICNIYISTLYCSFLVGWIPRMVSCELVDASFSSYTDFFFSVGLIFLYSRVFSPAARVLSDYFEVT